MKKALLTKLFYFSSSFVRGREIHGHNFILSVTVELTPKTNEARLEEKIQTSVIKPVHSRDLGMDVHFLKNIPITELNLLKVFSGIIKNEIKPEKLVRLDLERDKNTRFSLPAVIP